MKALLKIMIVVTTNWPTQSYGWSRNFQIDCKIILVFPRNNKLNIVTLAMSNEYDLVISLDY